jgi:hypothetical protein
MGYLRDAIAAVVVYIVRFLYRVSPTFHRAADEIVDSFITGIIDACRDDCADCDNYGPNGCRIIAGQGN